MRVAVITSVAWKSLPKRVKALQELISKHLPVKVEIVPILKDLGTIPTDKNGRVLGSWLKKALKTDGFDGACLLFERSQTDGNLKLGLKGHYFRDEDGYVEFWVCAKEKQSGGKFDKKRLDKFEHTFIHELAHGLYHWIGFDKTDDDTSIRPNRDNVHVYDKLGKLELAYKEIKSAWPKPKTVSTIQIATGGLKPIVQRASDLLVSRMEKIEPIRVTEGLRPASRQAELYAQGRTVPGRIVTKANVGQSDHEYGVAIDIVFRKRGYPKDDDPIWKRLWVEAQSCGFDDWGGLWIPDGWDKPHLAITKGKSWREFQRPGFDWTPWA